MTQDMVKTLDDGQLEQVVSWALSERKARAERRKQETIQKIRELALNAGIKVAIDGLRGRPPKTKLNVEARNQKSSKLSRSQLRLPGSPSSGTTLN